MASQCLTCPQLLSEDSLREILKDRCIELPDLESMDKIKLIEIFNRVALPMPQRIYNKQKLLGVKMQNLRLSRNVTIANYSEHTNLSTGITTVSQINSKSTKRKINTDHSDQMKAPINDDTLGKKIRLSNTVQSDISADEKANLKEKSEAPLKTDSKKRQKITWP